MLNQDVDRDDLLALILEEMERLYVPLMEGEESRSLIISEWKNLTDTLNVKVRMTDGDKTVEGMALDIDNEGALILELDDGSTKKFYSGDVSIVEKV
jgi:BirA family biotin operon repressor/biotin-[acetyl-CoA-carboxylase] ligase